MKLNKIDSYLQRDLLESREGEGLEFVAGVKPHGFPMLVRVRGGVWNPSYGFEVHARVGNIVSGRGDLDVLTSLEEDSNVLSVEASREGGIAECGTSVPFVRASNVHGGTPAELGERALVGVIDGGIDVLHEAFLDANGDPRIVEIWDQTDPTGPTPAMVHPALSSLNYGTVHDEAAIRGYVNAGTVPPALGPGPVGDRRDHGTHVASIAAGRAAGAFAGGVAPDARIVFVVPKLRSSPNDPFSLGYSSSHVEGLTYIKHVATTRGLPVAVNVSLGMNAGAHDGNSLLEAAFDDFSEGGRAPGFAVVKSAGNERRHDGHAKLMIQTTQRDTLDWNAAANITRNEDLVELWFRSSDELRFVLITPGGDRSAPAVDWGMASANGTFPSGNRYSLTYTRYHHDNGDSRLLVTIRPGNAPRIEPGLWMLEIVGKQVVSQGEVHAWVERDNTRPVRFTNHQDEEITLSIPGTARTIITVGAVNSQSPMSNQVNSSYGPTRDLRDKPDLVAPGTAILAAASGTTNGVLAKTGTSMAAPHVTGAIALLFSHRWKQTGAVLPNANQIRRALTQGTQNGNGRFTPASGYGLLDAEALKGAFD